MIKRFKDFSGRHIQLQITTPTAESSIQYIFTTIKGVVRICILVFYDCERHKKPIIALTYSLWFNSLMENLDSSSHKYCAGYSQISLMELNDTVIESDNPLIIWERNESENTQASELPHRMGHLYVVASDVVPPKFDILL